MDAESSSMVQHVDSTAKGHAMVMDPDNLLMVQQQGYGMPMEVDHLLMVQWQGYRMPMDIDCLLTMQWQSYRMPMDVGELLDSAVARADMAQELSCVKAAAFTHDDCHCLTCRICVYIILKNAQAVLYICCNITRIMG
jgi:hypothetical protein